jgi:endo-1,4-beta-D-glucanase Y
MIQNVISDVGADTDIAYALFKAGKEWKNPVYTREANLIVKDIWNQHVASVEGNLVLSSQKISRSGRTIDIRTSAIAPYAYEEFSRYDKTHNWKKLAADSYILINRLSGQEVHPGTNIFLPAEGAFLVKSNNKLEVPEEKYYSTNFTSDAYQVYWRVGVDAILNNNKTAQNYTYVTNLFDEEWKKGRACSIVEYTKKSYICAADLSSLSAPLAVWTVKDKKSAEELVAKYYLKNREFVISPSASFSEKSWFWFALGLWSDKSKMINSDTATLKILN